MGPRYRSRACATPDHVRSTAEYGGMTTTAEERVPIARLRAGNPIEDVFACTRKDRMTARTGTSYLAVELRDRSGAIPARVFRAADYLARQFDRGHPVQVPGRADLLMAAAILHDVGKTREFTLGAEIGLSDEGRLVGHIALCQEMVAERAAAAGGLDAARVLALRHCIAAHHGADALPGRRFGSPEALALYRLNALDASVKGALEHGLPR